MRVTGFLIYKEIGLRFSLLLFFVIVIAVKAGIQTKIIGNRSILVTQYIILE